MHWGLVGRCVPWLGDQGLIHHDCGLKVEVVEEHLDGPLNYPTDPSALPRLQESDEITKICAL